MTSFHWRFEGTINRLKTAQSLVQRQDASISTRLQIACHYCLTVDIHKLWELAPSPKEYPDVMNGYLSNIRNSVWGRYWFRNLCKLPTSALPHFPDITNVGQLLHLLEIYSVSDEGYQKKRIF
ncbi:hypothetical protein CEXT_357401 [Caerostris extrusa]|uniref:Uncharacterized protein n=1 Tax=Caerostris extrusa TaxID=172846 RepID=A0AAV4XJW4_CAEEX|nr:hypothetical protein CEXT_357401 [Caerostris extrusa]